MTKNPHTHATATMTQTLDAKKPPMTAAQLPLTAMARITSRSCPIRSATQPPHTHPKPPTAMAPNASRPSTAEEGTAPPARARPDHGPDRQARIRREPRRDHLHGRRVLPREAEPGEEARDEGERIGRRGESGGVDHRAECRRPREIPA